MNTNQDAATYEPGDKVRRSDIGDSLGIVFDTYPDGVQVIWRDKHTGDMSVTRVPADWLSRA